jgi:hypothetical protein
MWWWQCSEVEGPESKERKFDRETYFARYRALKTLLNNQMRIEGMIDLGKQLTALKA